MAANLNLESATGGTVSATEGTTPVQLQVNPGTVIVNLNTPLSSLSIGTTAAGSVTADINYAHTGTWTATQDYNVGLVLSFLAASTIDAVANTAAALVFSDGTASYLTFDTRTTAGGVASITLAGPVQVLTSAAGLTYSTVNQPAFTSTVTGVVVVTAMHGLQLNMGTPTLTDSSAATITVASTFYIAGAPVAAGSAVITNAYSMYVAGGVAYFGGGLSGSGGLGALTAGTGILGTAQSWTALQTFGTMISFMGEQLVGTTAAGDTLISNGTNWVAKGPNLVQNNTSYTSATNVAKMAGLALVVTPNATGYILINIHGTTAFPAVSADTMSFAAYYGTGSSPIVGSATVGTAMNPANVLVIANGTVAGAESLKYSWGSTWFVGGLTIGTAYWFDLQITPSSVTSTTNVITGVAVEIK